MRGVRLLFHRAEWGVLSVHNKPGSSRTGLLGEEGGQDNGHLGGLEAWARQERHIPHLQRLHHHSIIIDELMAAVELYSNPRSLTGDLHTVALSVSEPGRSHPRSHDKGTFGVLLGRWWTFEVRAGSSTNMTKITTKFSKRRGAMRAYKLQPDVKLISVNAPDPLLRVFVLCGCRR